MCGPLTSGRAAMIPKNPLLYISIIKNNIKAGRSGEKAYYSLLAHLKALYPEPSQPLLRSPSPQFGSSAKRRHSRLTSSEGVLLKPVPGVRLALGPVEGIIEETQRVIEGGCDNSTLLLQLQNVLQQCQLSLCALRETQRRDRVRQQTPQLVERTIVLLLTTKVPAWSLSKWGSSDSYTMQLSVRRLSELMRSVNRRWRGFSEKALYSNELCRRDLRQWYTFMQNIKLANTDVAKELKTLIE